MNNKRQTQGQRIAILEANVEFLSQIVLAHDKELGKLVTDDKEIIKDLENESQSKLDKGDI